MLIQYAVGCEKPSLMEICSVFFEDDSAYFVPVREDFSEIKISGMSQYEYEDVLRSLYAYGKTDLTKYKAKTSEVDYKN